MHLVILIYFHIQILQPNSSYRATNIEQRPVTNMVSDTDHDNNILHADVNDTQMSSQMPTTQIIGDALNNMPIETQNNIIPEEIQGNNAEQSCGCRSKVIYIFTICYFFYIFL